MSTTQTTTTQRLYPALQYRDAPAAIAWLKDVLGFEERQVCPEPDGTISHAELALEGELIMLGSVKPTNIAKSPLDLGGVAGTVYIGLDTPADVEARYERAKRAGAEIVRELTDTDYGSREFGVRDLEGYLWSFGTYRP
jgi:uncharacterized glyoxalase superfamily protein PhnB